MAQVCGRLKIPTRKLLAHSLTPIFVREQLSDVALQWQQMMEYLGLFPSKSAVNVRWCVLPHVFFILNAWRSTREISDWRAALMSLKILIKLFQIWLYHKF